MFLRCDVVKELVLIARPINIGEISGFIYIQTLQAIKGSAVIAIMILLAQTGLLETKIAIEKPFMIVYHLTEFGLTKYVTLN